MLLQTTSTTTLWGVGELVLSSAAQYGNPFRDVAVTAVFRAPSGREVRALGFHDGDRVWRIRLLPDEVGTWTFTTYSADGELDGATGSIEVRPARAGAHGPVRVSGTHHFAHADGTPYFLLGTTLYFGLVGGPEERTGTVAKLSGSPFTKARFMLLGGLMRPGQAPSPFERTAEGLDYARPDPAFFRDVEQGIGELQALGVEADLIFFLPYFDLFARDGAFGERSPSNMGPDDDEQYVRYVAARLSAFANVWWTLANEFDLHKVQKDWTALARAVADGDPYGHLLSNHHSILGFFDNSRPWITHVNLQDVLLQRAAGGPRNLGELPLDARAIGKPVVVDEYGYEGNNGFTWGSFSGPEMVEMHWAATLAGAYASHGESFAGAQEEDRFLGDAVPRLRFLREVLESAPYQELRPANDVLTYAGDAFVPMALAKPGEEYLVYFPVPRELPDWNLGNFGPATPSRPLPLTGLGEFAMIDTAVTVTVAEGRYEVAMIDPWRMSVLELGVTEETRFTVAPRLAPGILRLRRDPGSDAPAQPVEELLRAAGLG